MNKCQCIPVSKIRVDPGHNGNKVVVSAKPGLSTSRWYHATAAFNGTSVTLYVNGVKYSAAACNGFLPSSLDLAIGKYAPSSAGYFDGDVAMVRIYGRALNGTGAVNNFKADQWRVTTTAHPFLLFHDIADTPGYQHRSAAPWSDWEERVISPADAAINKDFADPTWNTEWEADNWVSARGQYAYTGWSMIDTGTIRITTSGGEHNFEVLA